MVPTTEIAFFRNLFGLLEGLYQPTDVRPDGYPDAVVWQGGNFDGKVEPVAHSLTDAYALRLLGYRTLAKARRGVEELYCAFLENGLTLDACQLPLNGFDAPGAIVNDGVCVFGMGVSR